MMDRFFSRVLKHTSKEDIPQDNKRVAVRAGIVDGEGGEKEQHRVRALV